MPIFSALYVLAIIYNTLGKGTLKEKYVGFVIITCILEICHFQGVFVNSSNLLIENINRYVLLLVTLIYFWLRSGRIKVAYKEVGYIVIMLMIPFVSYFRNDLYPLDTAIMPLDNQGSWDGFCAGIEGLVIGYKCELYDFRRYYIMFITPLLSLMIIKSDFTFCDYKKVINNLSNVATLMIVWGWGEFFVKNVIDKPDIFYEFKKIFFGVNLGTTVMEPSLRGGLYQLEGVSKEASHFVIVLFILAVALLIKKYVFNLRDRYFSKKILCIFMLMFLSGGFSAVWYSFFLLVLLGSFKFDVFEVDFSKMRQGIIIFLGIVILLFAGLYWVIDTDLYIGYRLRVLSEVFDIISDGNFFLGEALHNYPSLPRLVSMIIVSGNFCEYPLLGLGLGITYAHSSLITSLAQVGIIGVLVWCLLINTSVNKCDKYSVFFLIIFVFMAGAFQGFTTGITMTLYNMIFFEFTKFYKRKMQIC